MNFVRRHFDLLLYAGIAAITAAQAYVASGDIPRQWGPPLGILGATLIAVKAKRSKGATAPESPTVS